MENGVTLFMKMSETKMSFFFSSFLFHLNWVVEPNTKWVTQTHAKQIQITAISWFCVNAKRSVEIPVWNPITMCLFRWCIYHNNWKCNFVVDACNRIFERNLMNLLKSINMQKLFILQFPLSRNNEVIKWITSSHQLKHFDQRSKMCPLSKLCSQFVLIKFDLIWFDCLNQSSVSTSFPQ